MLINSTKPIWNAAGEKDVGVGAGAVRNVGGKYYAEDRETQIGVLEFSDPLRSWSYARGSPLTAGDPFFLEGQ